MSADEAHDWRLRWGWPPGAGPAPAVESAYVHVPFCHHRCGYCNFSLIAGRPDLIESYLAAVQIELEQLREPWPVRTLYIGGGTPSLLRGDQAERLLALLRHWLPLVDGGEWTCEVNPQDVTQQQVQLWRSAGVNRLSVGGQSFALEKLKRLERQHSPEQLRQAISLCCDAVSSVSLDLIFAAPGESLSGWLEDVEAALECGAKHLSAYGLTYEKGARFWSLARQQDWSAVSEETELAMYLGAKQRLERAGWEHYEISSFAVPGHRSQHNQVYWRGENWWAFGPGAARYVAGRRSMNHPSTSRYLKLVHSGECPVFESEDLTPADQARERLVFGLRQLAGVDWSGLQQDYPDSILEPLLAIIDRQAAAGWLAWSGTRLALTAEGLVISDGLWPEYFDR
jgi:oxygen-independent coproporphyrinogen III oxidase